MNAVRAISFGGGVQSTALLVMAARREIDYRLALFCNVGDDSEHPATLAYVRDYSEPFARDNGIELVTLRKTKRDGSVETVFGRATGANRSIGIPVRMANGAPGTRQCTLDFKVMVVARELRRRGASRENPGTVALGISVDEYHRMRSDTGIAWERLDYPLIERRLSRRDCLAIVRDAGLPAPPKSSCWFCPFHGLGEWARLRAEAPDLFQRAVEMERRMNEKRASWGKDPVWLTRRLVPLDEAIADPQPRLFDDDSTCDVAGYCGV